MLLHLDICVVTVGVRPLEHLSALDDGLAALYQELALGVGEVQDFDERVDAHYKLALQLFREPSRPLMVNVPLIRVDIPLHVLCSLCALPLLNCKTSVRCELLLVDVALVVASRGGPVFAPVAQADPAEVVVAVPTAACHVVAALVLLNVCMAFWARLRVGEDPGRVLALRALLLDPELGLVAGAGLVRVEPALEAELDAAFALNLLQVPRVL